MLTMVHNQVTEVLQAFPGWGMGNVVMTKLSHRFLTDLHRSNRKICENPWHLRRSTHEEVGAVARVIVN
jgi:hypothetical protein